MRIRYLEFDHDLMNDLCQFIHDNQHQPIKVRLSRSKVISSQSWIRKSGPADIISFPQLYNPILICVQDSYIILDGHHRMLATSGDILCDMFILPPYLASRIDLNRVIDKELTFV